jgi:chemotaxis protein methyltransferase CheR
VKPALDEIEMRLLLDAIYSRYHYDFRRYASASLKRRLSQALVRMDCDTISTLQGKILHDPSAFTHLLEFLTVQVSDLFRDPEVYLTLRRDVVPLLATYPSLKIWVAGCSTGEEAYSFAILLAEERLLHRSLIYATDINDESLNRARSGIYSIERLKQFTLNHRESGGRGSLSDYYHAAHDNAVMAAQLRDHITFADHSLATDSAFSEVQLISCRNVLIYFDRELQDRAIGLFRESLCHRGFLCLGTKEALRFSSYATSFEEVHGPERIFRKVS